MKAMRSPDFRREVVVILAALDVSLRSATPSERDQILGQTTLAEAWVVLLRLKTRRDAGRWEEQQAAEDDRRRWANLFVGAAFVLMRLPGARGR